jgi:hypothetical protein
MAARDFEDLLQVNIFPGYSYFFATLTTCDNQCSIPVFDGLFAEPHNSAIQRLLFLCAHWHGLAKLRMHSDVTLSIMDEATASLGKAFRDFSSNMCPTYKTKELRRECDARRRRRSKHANASTKTAPPPGGEPLRKTFNLQTYKYHALDDYSRTIRRFGTTDSYSTAIVSIII